MNQWNQSCYCFIGRSLVGFIRSGRVCNRSLIDASQGGEKRMSKKMLEIAADIVQGQALTTRMSTEEIVSSLKGVFGALIAMQRAEGVDGNRASAGISEKDQAETAPKATNPMDSIRDDIVVCLECGTQMRQLTAKHLQSHGLSVREYKKKWGLKLKQPLIAKSVSKARSKAAKKRGLPKKLQDYLDAKKAAKKAAPSS
jgi:predicted transcriptional regulator